MKQSLPSLMKTVKLYRLMQNMAENSKNACWLLFSVILLTGTVTGIAGPLDSCVQKMTDQTGIMRKEIALYREFTASRDRVQKQAQQRMMLQRLQELMPEEIDAEEEVKGIYQLAGLHGITVRKLKQIPDSPVRSKATGSRINRLLWETEFSGTWHDLTGFLNELETRGPCTRMEAIQIRKFGETGKDSVSFGTGKCAELSVRSKICVYYCHKKAKT